MRFVAQSGRVDKVLQTHLGISRNQVENFIKKGFVKIDGRVVRKCGYKLNGGEIIEYDIKKSENDTAIKVDFDIDILYEDDDILVVNKPSFLTVHPAPSVKEATLVDWLKSKNISLSTISGEERHGIVHRIDKQTSGALVVAKNNEAHLKLSKQLEDKSMGRYYLALIDLPLKESVTVEKSIKRDIKNRLRMAVHQNGRVSKSRFEKLLLSKDEKIELIAAKLYTGRTHQIRVHLKSLSRHILGDDLYGFKSKNDKIKRVMLHAYVLYLIHPTFNKKMSFIAPVAEDFLSIINDRFEREEFDEKSDPNNIVAIFDTDN